MNGGRRGSAKLHAVILAGGAGERFWPRSRERLPKPFLPLFGATTLFDAALERARRFCESSRLWVVCGREHARLVRVASRLPARQILIEPSRRNTAMAVAIAAHRIAAEDPDAVMVVLAADHSIPDSAAFARAVRRCARAAAERAVLVTLGVRPTRAETGYGYIRVGEPIGGRFAGLHRVRRFVEKPPASRARRFWRSGDYLWNAAIFVWKARDLLDEMASCAPELDRALAPLRRRRGGRISREALHAAYRRAPSLPIDKAVLERSRRVWTLPVAFRWSDLGTWASLAQELGVDERANRVVAGDVIFDAAHGNLVWGEKRNVALLGVAGLAVIDSPDALLIASLEKSGELRRLVATLRARGRRAIL